MRPPNPPDLNLVDYTSGVSFKRGLPFEDAWRERVERTSAEGSDCAAAVVWVHVGPVRVNGGHLKHKL